MEIVAVIIGIPNSLYTTFGGELPTTILEYIPALPLIALVVAETGRVPLASVVYEKHRFMQLVAILGVSALGYLAVENWTFGFERIVDLRLKAVNAASRELSRVENNLSALVEHRNQVESTSGGKREELRRGIGQRDANINELTSQLTKEASIHQKNLEGIREACRVIREKCMVPRSQAEDSRYTKEVDRLTLELARQREDRKRLQAQIDGLVSSDAQTVEELDPKITAARAAVVEAHNNLRSAQDGNQIYRLAASWYGVNVSGVTPEQFATARKVFAMFSAVAVSLAGSIAALVYYATSRVPGAPPFLAGSLAKLVRARQAYYARKRRPLKVEVPGPERVVYRDGKEIVEKEVPHYIERDHIVLIPRWGIWVPTYINSLIRSAQRSFGGDQHHLDDQVDSDSKVMQLKKKVN
jgi:hypothetical protein